MKVIADLHSFCDKQASFTGINSLCSQVECIKHVVAVVVDPAVLFLVGLQRP